MHSLKNTRKAFNTFNHVMSWFGAAKKALANCSHTVHTH